jgi:hypothetical protein
VKNESLLGGRPFGESRSERFAAEHYTALRAEWAVEGRPLPRSVEEEFEGYLERGGLEEGFLLVRCESCCARAARRAMKSLGSTKSPGAILNGRRLARRAQGRMPGVASRAWCGRDRTS